MAALTIRLLLQSAALCRPFRLSRTGSPLLLYFCDGGFLLVQSGPVDPSTTTALKSYFSRHHWLM